MNPINLIFAGTAEIGVPLLKKITEDGRFKIPLIITQEDRVSGRKMELTPSPVKKVSQELDLELFQPKNINSTESLERISSFQPDLMLVFAYGQLLKEPILDLPKKGCLNVHTSLLPKYRGASPIQAALLNGDKETGVTLMQMEKGLDSGPIFEIFPIPIESNDNAQTLHHKLAELSAEKIPDLLVRIMRDNLSPTAQNHDQATHVGKIEKSDGQINWNENVHSIANKVRAFYGWPSTYTFFKGKLLKIHEAKAHQIQIPKKPGTVIQKEGSVGVVCNNGFLELINVQPEGKKPQSIKEFVNGNQDFLKSNL